ncbi:DUF924 family protein [Tissierella sp. Yu-01]|uniref:DUF924 family protein n=1 Tax=Tissierella sp. Yu-01 TaxID=3035694 RepID=UPI00240D27FB|nr:DUF924 family protein [Tissierella sp. Yu-01]WFA08567.1 DUF924 domain-containing protein [Tissierella sp. Yu-01]
MTIATWQEVLDFWFEPENTKLHFVENDEFDLIIRERFLDTWMAASEGLLVDWRKTIGGRLAEIIVLDQFSRNLWRNDIKTYTQDKMAIALAQEVVNHPEYETLLPLKRKYVLLPFMHSESTALHDWAMPYFESMGDEQTLYFEKKHRAILDKFGRYPYQNKDLGRESTPEEEKWLLEKDGDFFS